MADAPQFAARPYGDGTTIDTANTARDGTGTIGTICLAGENGGRVEAVRVKATGTTTAGMIRIFKHSGGKWRLIGEVQVAAITVSASTKSFGDTWVPVGGYLTLAKNERLGASTHNAETFNVFVEGGDF